MNTFCKRILFACYENILRRSYAHVYMCHIIGMSCRVMCDKNKYNYNYLPLTRLAMFLSSGYSASSSSSVSLLVSPCSSTSSCSCCDFLELRSII